MKTTRRLTVTVPVEIDATLRATSEANNIPVSRLVVSAIRRMVADRAILLAVVHTESADTADR